MSYNDLKSITHLAVTDNDFCLSNVYITSLWNQVFYIQYSVRYRQIFYVALTENKVE